MTEADWWASAEGRSTCKMCGEQPPGVQEVADGRGIQNYCVVCSHSWWVQGGPLTAAEYRAVTPKAVPEKTVTDVSGYVMSDP